MMEHMKTDEYQNRIKLFLGALDHYAGFFKSFICIPVNNHNPQQNGKSNILFKTWRLDMIQH